jgi:hypothetical protein
MKLTGIIATAAMVVAGVFAQNGSSPATTTNSTASGGNSFNLTTLNGTWHMAGLNTKLFKEVALLSKFYNLTLSCPQIYIAGNSTNASYIESSLILGWYNYTTQQPQNANISWTGLMTLNKTGANATFAKFHAQFSLPFAQQNMSSSASYVEMLDTTTLIGGNASDPLPNGADFEVDLNVTLASSFKNATKDVVLISASNFTYNDTQYEDDYSEGYENSYANMLKISRHVAKGNKKNGHKPFFIGLFTNVSDTLDANNFTAVTSSLGSAASNLTRLNDTCTSTSSSQGSSQSSTMSTASSQGASQSSTM